MARTFGSKELSQFITSEQWDRAIGLCQSKPATAKAWSAREGFFDGIKTADVLPLHEACANGAPPDVVTALITAYPKAVSTKESSYWRLPLHIACRKHADPEVIRILMDAHSKAALQPDVLGRLPIHYALSNHAPDDAILMLLKEPNSARGTDKRGWLPLHVACSTGSSTFVVGSLIDAYPEAVVICTEKGNSARKCAKSSPAPNRSEVAALLKDKKKEFEKNWRQVPDKKNEAHELL